MKIQVIAVGATRTPYVREGVADYLSRLRGPRAVEWLEVKADPGDRPDGRAREAERILARVPSDSTLVRLDEHGEELTSEAFAARLGGWQASGTRLLSFAIGGAYGFDPAVASRARFTVSLSKMTFPHELVRLVLVEQLYRAFQILDGTGYHHGGAPHRSGAAVSTPTGSRPSTRSARGTRRA
ncbi:MAG: 23S rRNA (pseudouridine(1915)-N(3))-methyltransferase RlmH [bacterium]